MVGDFVDRVQERGGESVADPTVRQLEQFAEHLARRVWAREDDPTAGTTGRTAHQYSVIRSFGHLRDLSQEEGEEKITYEVSGSVAETFYTSQEWPLTVTVNNNTSQRFNRPVYLYANGYRVASEVVSIEPGEHETVDLEPQDPNKFNLGNPPENQETVSLQVNDKRIGYISLDNTEENSCNFPSNQAYPMRGYDAGNTGFNPASKGPSATAKGDAPPVSWQTEFDDDATTYGITAADGKLFTSTDDHIVAIDPCTGEQLWSTPIERGAGAPPSYMNGSVYFASHNGNLYGMDADDGDVFAQQGVNERSTAVAAVDGQLFVTNNDARYQGDNQALISFDADLNKRWSVEPSEQGFTGRPAVTAEYVALEINRKVGANESEQNIGLYDINDGTEKWFVERSTDDAVAIVDDTIYSSGYTGSGLALEALSIDDGSVLDSAETEAERSTSGLVVDGSSVFVGGDSGVEEFQIGSSISHQRTFETETRYSESVFHVTPDYIYVPHSDGTAAPTYLVTAFDRSTGMAEWQYNFGRDSILQTFVFDDVLYAATEDSGIIALG